MFGLAPVYICSKCGDVWDVYTYMYVDVENDDIIPILHCGKCSDSFLKPKEKDGVPEMHEITEEEHLELTGFYNLEDEY
ncbi:MAG TPA: hypothetical protein VN026_11520 [Bacteroidia bacterium]|jgi:hypothetical protein|nr:hypothetical protein [Bacteroidia bacterium]